MTTQRSTVIGVFSDRDKAQAAVDDLRRSGFRDDQIGLVSRTVDGGATAVHASGPDRLKERTGHGSADTQWEEGAGVGAAAGAATGAGLGLAVAAGLIPGIGQIVVGGVLAAIAASAGTGAVVGGLIGALVGLGIPEHEAAYYDTEVRTGRTVVTVRADDKAAAAWDALAQHGAYDFDRRPADMTAGTGLEATP